MPWTVIFLEDLGPGEKGIAEMLAPESVRRLTLCFSVVSITPDSSLCFSGGYRAWMGGSRTRHWVGGSGLCSPGSQGQCAFQWFPWQMRQGPRGSFLRGHSLLKWPACPHWKHVLGFGLCPGEVSLSAGIRASSCLSFLFSFSRSFFSFSKSLL
jgi:hypothetical protein